MSVFITVEIMNDGQVRVQGITTSAASAGTPDAGTYEEYPEKATSSPELADSVTLGRESDANGLLSGMPDDVVSATLWVAEKAGLHRVIQTLRQFNVARVSELAEATKPLYYAALRQAALDALRNRQ